MPGMRTLKRILIGAGALLLLAVPACLLMPHRPAPASAPTAVSTTPEPARPGPPAAAPIETPAPPSTATRTTVPPEPVPAAESRDPVSRLVALVLPRPAKDRSDDDCEIPGDPIGSTICRMRCYLRDHPDALAERPVVKRPGVVYWHESNLVAHDF